MMRAKSVLVLRQNLQAQDSATEERSNRASRPIVKFPRVSPSESSFDHRVKGRIEAEREQGRAGDWDSQKAGSDASP